MPQFDFSASGPYPVGAAPITGSSGSVANASAVATLAGAANKTTYITGFVVSGLGATAGAAVTITVANLLGGDATYRMGIPAGATVPAGPYVVSFPFPLPANAVNTAITVTAGAFGAGNTSASATATGYQL